MAGFRKAKAEQASLKVAFYGNAGSGKTFTALLCAEGLAKLTGKRVAYVDTERGTDFYCKEVKERFIHPEPFDFDALYTRSITEATKEIKSLSYKDYSVIVIDSITHLWEATIAAYSGKTTSAGTIPIQAWGRIKKPYKDLMTYLLSSKMHVFICGRQGNDFDTDADTGEFKKVGTKMKAEGETPYEPHILLHLEAEKNLNTGTSINKAFAEKDRTGILSGKTIINPCFDNLIKPIYYLLGNEQASLQSSDEASSIDAEEISKNEIEKESESTAILKKFKGKISICENNEELSKIGKEITSEVKKKMLSQHVAELRQVYMEAESFLR